MAHFVKSGKLTLDDIKEAEEMVRELSQKEKTKRFRRNSVLSRATFGNRRSLALGRCYCTPKTSLTPTPRSRYN
jgi:hypothetical protein